MSTIIYFEIQTKSYNYYCCQQHFDYPAATCQNYFEKIRYYYQYCYYYCLKIYCQQQNYHCYLKFRGRPGLYRQSLLHSGVHVWVGGHWTAKSPAWGTATAVGDMLDIFTSPNDPLFFSHHANLDRLYYYWRQHIGVSNSQVRFHSRNLFLKPITLL